MVKTPKMRHSKAKTDPVTIDLGPGEMSRIEKSKAETTASGEKTTAGKSDDKPKPASAAPKEDAATKGPASESASSAKTTPGATDSTRPKSDDVRKAAGAKQPGSPSRVMAGLVGGIAGGFIVLVVAGAAQFAGLLAAPGASGSGGVRTLQTLQSEVGVMSQKIASLEEERGSQDGQSTDRIDSIATAVGQMEADLTELKSARESDTGGGPDMQALDARMKALETAVAGLGQDGENAGTTDLGPITGKISEVETAVGAATATLTATDERVAGLEKRITTLTEQMEARSGQPRVALAIAASALKAAVARGGPFAAEVDTFGAVAPDAPQLADLRAIAEQGAPSRADILAKIPDAANAMIAAANPVDENAGYFDRLLSSAESLVKVRPIGAVEGEDAAAIVARMESALKADDFAKALAEYETLPEPSKAAGAEFAESIRARVRAEELADKALASALKAD